MRKVSAITVNYNQIGVTTELLDSFRRCGYSDVEIIVVDNASKEDPSAFLQANYPEVKVIRSETNWGFAGGNNLGIRQATGDYFFFINNDAEVTEGSIEKLVAALEASPRNGVVSPKICFYKAEPSGKQNHDGADKLDIIQYVGTTTVHPLTARNSTLGEKEPDTGQYNELKPTAYAHGAAMMMKREVVDKVGEWPELFFLYYEELDWCAHIRRAGYEIVVEPNAKIYHKESYTTGQLNALKTYYINRNRVLFMRRNHSAFQLLAFILFLLLFTIPKNTLLYLLRREWSHLRAFYKAIWWNILDVLKLDNERLNPIPSPRLKLVNSYS